MAISLVQVTTGNDTDGTVVATLGSPAAAGNHLIAVAYANVNHPSHSISGFTKLVGIGGGSLWIKEAAGGEPDATLSGSGATFVQLHLYEYDGLEAGANGGFDRSGTNSGSAVTSINGILSAVTTTADQLVLAAVNMSGTHGGGGGWTNGFGEQGNTNRLRSAHNIVASADDWDTTASWTTTRNCSIIIASFRAAASSVTVSGNKATETDTANTGTPVVVTSGARASETDSANAGTPAVSTQGSRADETTTASSGSPVVVVAGQQATETTTASGGVAVVVVAGQTATETTTASGGAPAVAIPGGQATETDTAQGGVPVGGVIRNITVTWGPPSRTARTVEVGRRELTSGTSRTRRTTGVAR